MDDIKKDVRNKKLAVCFIRHTNLKICTPILNMLRDAFLTNQDLYPETLEEAYALVQNHSSSKKKAPPQQNQENKGVQNRNQRYNRLQNRNSTVTGQSFFQQRPTNEKPFPGLDRKVNENIQCWKC